MMSAFFRRLSASLLFTLSAASAQEPELFHPLWEISNMGETAASPPVIGQGAPLPEVFATLDSGEGLAARSVPESVSDEIAQLARALGNDPVRIFNHVRNTIDYDQYFGLRKGPELTLLEGRGNDLDTCSLLAELLKAAGYTDYEFVWQVRQVPLFGNDGKNLREWIGFSENPYPGQTYQQVTGIPNPYPIDESHAKQIQNAFQYLKVGRSTPYVAIWPVYESLGMTRFWLKLTYQGVRYDLDPSFKRYQKVTGIDLASAAGYLTSGKDRAALLATAGGTAGAGYIDALNNANVKAFLNARNMDLLSYLTQNPNATVEQMIGGRKIIKEEITHLSQAYSLPKMNGEIDGSDGFGTMILAGNTVPTAVKTTVRFQTGTLDYSIPTADLKGRKVALASSGNEVQLWIDQQKVAWTTVTTPTYAFTMTVTHLFSQQPSYTETKIYKKHDETVYALIYGFSASQRLIEKRYEQLDEFLKTDDDASELDARSEILNIIGLTWMYQVELAKRVLAAKNEISALTVHSFGRVAHEDAEAHYVDVGLRASADRPLDGSNGQTYDNHTQLGAMFASAMEHGIIEQMKPGSTALSTINVLRYANELTTGNKRIYVINPALVASGSPWTAAKTDLAAYNAAATKNGRYDEGAEPFTDNNPTNGRWDPGETYTDYTELQQFEHLAQNGASVMVPKNRQVTQTGWTWKGSGWVIRSPTRAGMIIGGTYSGGYSSFWSWLAPRPISNVSYASPSFTYSSPSFTYSPPSYSSPRLFGGDPVDMATGAFTLSSDDMSTGIEGAPRGLAFSRQYSTNSADKSRQRIGHGWTHSLHISAYERTATEESLGLGNPRQMAAFLTAMTIGSDLYRRDATAKEWMTASLTVGWYTDQLTNNAVSVEIGNQLHQFTKNPDGSYEPQTGSTMALQKVGTAPNHTYTLSQRNGNRFVFEKAAGNTDGSEQRIKEILDPDDKKMLFSYHPAAPDNRLYRVTDSVNRYYEFRYDANNRIDRVTDSSDADRYVGFAYDTSGNLVTYTDPLSKNTYYDYEVPAGQTPADPAGSTAAQHRIVRHRNHDGSIITQNVFDSLGRVKEQYLHGDTAKTYKLYYTGAETVEENPQGGRTHYFYDERGRATGTRDASGNTESWVHDGHDRIVEKTTGSGETTVFHYDSRHNLEKVDHPRGGGSTRYFYDSRDRIDLVIDPDDHQTDYVYNAGNTKDRPDQVIDPAGTTTFQYITSGHAIGRIWKITQDSLTIEYAYDTTSGHPDWIKEPGVPQTEFTFNQRGDLSESTDPNGIKTSYLYNDRRQVTKITRDPGGATEAVEDITYDNQGLENRKTGPAGYAGNRIVTRMLYSPTDKIRYAYTSDNDAIEANDPYTETRYDSRDWQSHVLDPVGRVTTLVPQANGELYQNTPPPFIMGRTKTTLYDGDNRPVTTTVPGSSGNRTTGVVYDTAPTTYPRTVLTTPDNLSVSDVQDRSGRTRFHTNRKNQTWEFRFDGLGRKTHVITPLDAVAGRASATEYHHRGVVKKITEPSGQETDYVYNSGTGRLSSVEDDVGTISHTAYDSNGNLLNTQEARNGVTGTKTTSRTYDRQQRIASRTDENGQTIGYRYYRDGKLAKIIYPGGSESGIGHVEYTWWPDGRLRDVIDKLDSTTSSRTTSYEWHTDGRLKKVTRDNGTIREIKYDAAGRPDLITEAGPGNKLIFVHKHGFYPSDEMQWRYELPSRRTSGTDPPAMKAMTYNADNQLADWDGQTVTHDPDGNMTAGPAPDGTSPVGYSYDARNRLISALDTTYTYDADGQRVGMSKGGTATTFVTDVGSSLSKVLVRTKGGVVTRYVWGLGLLYEVNGSGSSATTVSYHHDATGSTIALSDDDAKVIERIGYTPFGQVNHRANLTGTPHDTPFLFTGFFGNQSDGNGLIYMRNRYYHPRIARFLNADPAQEGMNWYGYAGGNPVGFVDPMGLGINSVLNAVQTTLSFLGMTPVFGAVFDIVNAGISIGRGNYVDAAFHVASAIPGIGDFAAGAKMIGGGFAAYGGYQAASIGIGLFSTTSRAGSSLWDVGIHAAMSSPRSIGLQSHHVGQSAVMGKFISGYNRELAPAILVPTVGHTIKGSNGILSRSTEGFKSARDVIARDIKELRRVYSDVPNTQLQKLIDLNKKMYPVLNVKNKP